MKLALMGLTGAGKGTQSERIEQEYGIPHISTGDLLRNNSDRGVDSDGYLEQDDPYETIQDVLDRGGAPPAATVRQFLDERLDQGDTGDGYVLDGWPRSEEQAEQMDEMDELDAMVYLRVDDEQVLYDRLLERGRDDDTRDNIERKIDRQSDNIDDMYDHYQDHDAELIEIDAEQGIDEVWTDLAEELEQL
ncbi:MAG: nucleoside monophosphate kinase [Candidatus Nanohaloarchaea archaeon]|nr:nucleoside monophosphate kinase [Candidatus Nanohaloarchaea archaeon]